MNGRRGRGAASSLAGQPAEPSPAGRAAEAPCDAPAGTAGEAAVGAALGPVLPAEFYDRPVVEVARDLIGCGFFFNGVGGRIVETEAYAHDDPCCHGFRGLTARNAVMFGPPGRLYVYFTYGMHFCCNLVCEREGRAAAVLLRALEPTHGLGVMRARRGRAAVGADGEPADDRVLCSGPAKLTQALGIGREQNGLPAWQEPLVVTARQGVAAGRPAAASAGEPRIVVTSRIGVGDDRAPWRFVDADSRFLSRPLPRRVRSPGRAQPPRPG